MSGEFQQLLSGIRRTCKTMSKGTILYIGGFELPDKNAAAHRVLNNAKIFRELEYDVVFIGIDKSLVFGNDVLSTKKIVQGFDCWAIPYPSTKSQWIHYLCGIYEIKKIVVLYENIKYVICYNYQAYALVKLKRFCKKNLIKIIGDCTEWYCVKDQSLSYGVLKWLDTFFRMRIIHQRLDGLIVISTYLKKYYSKCKNIICVPPLVDKEEGKWKNQIISNIDDKITIVYAGSPGNKDKINLFIDILLNVDNIKEKVLLKIIGINRNEYIILNPLHGIIIDKIDEFTEFYGRMPHNDVISIICSSDFSAFLRENKKANMAGFPTKFVESISCGIPVLTNNTSDLDEYLVDGENGYMLNLDDKENAVSKFENILDSSNKNMNRMKQICSNSKIFDYRNYIDLVWEFMRKIDN